MMLGIEDSSRKMITLASSASNFAIRKGGSSLISLLAACGGDSDPYPNIRHIARP
jgi:hypothetical protein